MNLFRKKSVDQIINSSEGGEHKLKRTLGPWSLVSLGIGAIIGAGLFSLTGIAAAENAGPAVVLSFVVAAFGAVGRVGDHPEFSGPGNEGAGAAFAVGVEHGQMRVAAADLKRSVFGAEVEGKQGQQGEQQTGHFSKVSLY